jgi:hypothetical protein
VTDEYIDFEWGDLAPLNDVMDSKPFWPSLVIELRRAPGHEGYQEMAVTPFDWEDELPDVIILESRIDIDIREMADGRIVHVYYSPQSREAWTAPLEDWP